MLDFLMANKEVILMALFALSEVLALIPGIKSNSVFTLIYNLVKGAVGKKEVPPAA